MDLSILEITLCILLISLIVTVLFRKLRLSIILGYLCAGALVGPHGLGLAHNSQYAKSLAEFGIVFLMFTIGLEFSLSKLFALRYAVFLIGGLQVFLTVLITTLAAIFFGMPHLAALTVGSIVAMSSTAIVIKQLNDQNELFSKHGLNAVGILLFQDLAVIPIIILIGGIAQGERHAIITLLAWALLKGILAILVIFLIGRWLLRPLFRIIEKTHAIELFTMMVLLVTLASAWLTNLMGLSYALGAFLAGLMLAETEYRHEIANEIRPFRDILLALFFITIGMLVNIHLWSHTWAGILLLVGTLIIGKMLLITLICRLTGNSLLIATKTGILLAQGSEFGFAILTLALNNKILTDTQEQIVLAALLISIAISPMFIRYNQKITAWLRISNKQE